MSRQEARAVLLEAFQRCGFKIPFFKFEPFYMGYHLFQHTDVVFGFGIMDRQRRHLYGRQGVMIQVSLLLQKKVYVYDEGSQLWYVAKIHQKRGKKGQLKVWHRFEPCSRPKDPGHSMYFYDAFDPPEPTLRLIHQMTSRSEQAQTCPGQHPDPPVDVMPSNPIYY